MIHAPWIFNFWTIQNKKITCKDWTKTRFSFYTTRLYQIIYSKSSLFWKILSKYPQARERVTINNNNKRMKRRKWEKVNIMQYQVHNISGTKNNSFVYGVYLHRGMKDDKKYWRI